MEESLVEDDGQTRAVGVKGLTSYEAYRAPKEKKQRGPQATLNAVVVTRWKGEDVSVAEQVVLLTALPVDHPLKVVALYRKRGEMENKLHRDLKQGWYIEHFPCKQYQACLAHIYLTLTMYNVACAYKTERGEELADLGIRRLRAKHLPGGAWLAAGGSRYPSAAGQASARRRLAPGGIYRHGIRHLRHRGVRSSLRQSPEAVSPLQPALSRTPFSNKGILLPVRCDLPSSLTKLVFSPDSLPQQRPKTALHSRSTRSPRPKRS